MTDERVRLRCRFGRHTPITDSQAKPFLQWFEKPGLGGFRPYDVTKDGSLSRFVEAMMDRAFKRAYIMQINFKEYEYEVCWFLHIPALFPPTSSNLLFVLGAGAASYEMLCGAKSILRGHGPLLHLPVAV
jgi:hypothetical protein